MIYWLKASLIFVTSPYQSSAHYKNYLTTLLKGAQVQHMQGLGVPQVHRGQRPGVVQGWCHKFLAGEVREQLLGNIVQVQA